MGFVVVNYNVVTGCQAVYGGDYALITEVEQESVFLALKVGKHLLQLLVILGVPGKHTAAHRGGKAPFGHRAGLELAYLGMICKSEVIIEAPVEHRDTVENHMGAKLPFQAGIHIITESLLEILPDGAAAVAFYSVKNIKHLCWRNGRFLL